MRLLNIMIMRLVKVLIKNKFPFASIKYLNENFDDKK